ncbi:MAG: dienelactone hydrolase family protein [Planctomycetota bacterium]
METETMIYREGDQELEAFVARPEGGAEAPVVLVCHAWGGQGDFERDKARALARLGYVGFALDVYGVGQRGTDKETSQALMMPFVEDRKRLETRLLTALEFARSLPGVDSSRTAAIGFCFGGLCALDLARSGADLRGVVSFHGLLGGRKGLATQAVRAKVLVCHGNDDPMVSRDDQFAFFEEFDQAGADWQMHRYGKTLHAFTNPAAADPDFGTVYEPKAERRSLAAMADFLSEVFSE